MVRRMAEWRDRASPGVVIRERVMNGGMAGVACWVGCGLLDENAGMVRTVVKWCHDWMRDAALSVARIGIDGSSSSRVA